jgi:hypothetical protein
MATWLPLLTVILRSAYPTHLTYLGTYCCAVPHLNLRTQKRSLDSNFVSLVRRNTTSKCTRLIQLRESCCSQGLLKWSQTAALSGSIFSVLLPRRCGTGCSHKHPATPRPDLFPPLRFPLKFPRVHVAHWELFNAVTVSVTRNTSRLASVMKQWILSHLSC